MKRVYRFALGLGVLLVVSVIKQWPDAAVHLIMCDVGQGDAFLVKQGFSQVLIDGGTQNGAVLDCLGRKMPFWDRTLELVIMTHEDSDHAGGLEGVLSRYKTTMFLKPPGSSEDTQIDIEKKTLIAKQGMKLRLGEMMFEVLWPNNTPYDPQETNKTSLVLQMISLNRSVLFTGDVDREIETSLLNRGSILPNEVLKVAHHGSKFSTSDEFLQALKPRIALISVGKENRYGHPDQDVLMRLLNAGVVVLRTDERGLVELVATKEGWRVLR